MLGFASEACVQTTLTVELRKKGLGDLNIFTGQEQLAEYTHARTHARTRTHAHTHARTHTHTYTHTHTHTQQYFINP